MGKFYHYNTPVSNKCFGVEIEGYFRRSDFKAYPFGEYFRGMFVAADGSLEDINMRGRIGIELITQPLEYDAMMDYLFDTHRQVDTDFITSHAEAGVHVHVGRGICSVEKAQIIADSLCTFSDLEMQKCFGRIPGRWCINRGYLGVFTAVKLHQEAKSTVEFRSFASGNFAWAAECVRRAKLLCEIADKHFTAQQLIKKLELK